MGPGKGSELSLPDRLHKLPLWSLSNTHTNASVSKGTCQQNSSVYKWGPGILSTYAEAPLPSRTRHRQCPRGAQTPKYTKGPRGSKVLQVDLSCTQLHMPSLVFQCLSGYLSPLESFLKPQAMETLLPAMQHSKSLGLQQLTDSSASPHLGHNLSLCRLT